MNWTETRNVLITAGINPTRLPEFYRSSIDLRGASLRGADLYGANLRGADLRGAYLIGANLRGAYLIGANLRGAYLIGANLYGAYLIGANLYGASLRGADLYGAYLRDAYLRGADLYGVTLNWNSHDLLAEIARRAAGDAPGRRMAAGLILVSRDWCWDKFVAVLDEETKDWLGAVFAPYVKDGDAAPDVVKQYVAANARKDGE